MDKLKISREKEDTLRANKINKETQITAKEQEITNCDDSVDLNAMQKRVKDSQANLSELTRLEGTATNSIETNERELRGLRALAEELREQEGTSEASHKRAIISEDLTLKSYGLSFQARKYIHCPNSNSLSVPAAKI